MDQLVKDVCVIHGNSSGVFKAGEEVAFSEFAKETFGIADIFEKNLVTGRYICHEKDSDADVSLRNQEDVERFIFSEDPTRLRIILISNNSTNGEKIEFQSKPGSSTNIVASEKEREELVESVKELQLFMQTLRNTTNENKGSVYEGELQVVVHEGIFCDFCDLGSNSFTKQYIVGPRFKCLECSHFDLCSSCEAKGVEINSHKRHHNMVKVNTPLKGNPSFIAISWAVKFITISVGSGSLFFFFIFILVYFFG